MQRQICGRRAATAVVLATLMFSAQTWAVDCSGLPTWSASTAYSGGAKVKHQNRAYQANWWTQGNDPAQRSGQWQEWKLLGDCDGSGNNTPPTAALTSPTNGAGFITGATVNIAANASDSDGSVASVRFYVGAALIATDTAVPWTASWTAQVGNHTLRAEAVDDRGAVGSSATVSINVQNGNNNTPPQVSLTSPLNGASVAVGVSVTVSADASDSDGSVSKVQFFRNGVLMQEDLVAPWSANWTATAGNHQFSAKAFDDKGASTDSSSVSITVGNDDPGNNHLACRPDGLYTTPTLVPAYCSVYDNAGREKMGPNHPRRIIGYFTSWRTGKNGAPSYLAKDIPWAKLTHINYAFAHVDAQHRVSVGDVSDPLNAATGLTWPDVPGAEMDASLPYKGHFNLLNKFKKQYPHVKTLISVGGWAETGGYFDSAGKRVASGGFYTMTTNADNSVNTAGINAFANSAVAFIRQYGFDGVDIDYEYPTSMKDAGNPDDFVIANARRAGLMRSYVVLMKTLREKLDAAGAADNRHYLLTIAAPSSGYLVRGMENFQVTEYLDYVNIMSYDLHGAWNQFVGHNAALFDTGEDAELKAWSYYTASQYARIGYLNTDWTYHYFRGALPAGRINIGVPYYTRGWRNVSGGNNGLWGTAQLPDQSQCPPGTGGSTVSKCGSGAIGIDNIWHDLDSNGAEMGAGSNPMWHAKNLQDGRAGSYISQYGLNPVSDPDDRLSGSYTRHYDSVAVAPWLWNAGKKVFLSTEDEQSIRAKADYIADRGIGGVMFWELAGDYRWHADRGEYFIGDTLTSVLHDRLKTAAPYGNKRAPTNLPAQAVDVRFELGGFKLGDQNYPINPKLKITNQSGAALPGGTEFQFNVPTAIPDTIADQSGFGLRVIQSGANSSGHNIGGLQNDFHRVSMKTPAWQSLANGAAVEVTLNYYLPMTLPSSWTVKVGGVEYALVQEHPQLPKVIPGNGGGGGNACSAAGIDPATVVVYPTWPRGTFASGGDLIAHQQKIYRAKWWTNGVPGSDGSWELVCSY